MNIDVDWKAAEEQMKRQRAAHAKPDDPKSKPWIETGWMTPREREAFWRHLPDPLKRRGRPKGGPVATNAALLKEMERLVSGGVPPTTAARKLLDSKSKADHLVKLFKAQQR